MSSLFRGRLDESLGPSLPSPTPFRLPLNMTSFGTYPLIHLDYEFSNIIPFINVLINNCSSHCKALF